MFFLVLARFHPVGDVHNDPRYLTALGTSRSEIIVPILSDQGEVVGTVDVESEQPNAFDQKMEKAPGRLSSFTPPIVREPRKIRLKFAAPETCSSPAAGAKHVTARAILIYFPITAA